MDLKFEETSPAFYEKKLREQGKVLIAGTDEVGRGCLAGPVMAAAVILPASHSIQGIKDSKLLSPKQREKIFDEIVKVALTWAVAKVEVFEIDQINIFQASLKAMVLAVGQLSKIPDFLLIDGKFPLPLSMPQKAVVKGDLHCQSIAAASILAKVTRDREMSELEKKYPGFSFSVHKGYPTKKHREEIREWGVSEIHRKSFTLLPS